MQTEFEARWVSKERAKAIRKRSVPSDVLLLDMFTGFILVQPKGSDLGDGPVLNPTEMDAELQLVWFLGPWRVLRQARERLGLESGTVEAEMAHAGS